MDETNEERPVAKTAATVDAEDSDEAIARRLIAEPDQKDDATTPETPTGDEGIEFNPNAHAASEVTYEDGVEIVVAKNPAWCAKSGDRADWCYRARDVCLRSGTRCDRADNFACVKAVARTSGNAVVACFSTYEMCSVAANVMKQTAELRDVGDCVILRVPKKAPR